MRDRHIYVNRHLNLSKSAFLLFAGDHGQVNFFYTVDLSVRFPFGFVNNTASPAPNALHEVKVGPC